MTSHEFSRGEWLVRIEAGLAHHDQFDGSQIIFDERTSTDDILHFYVPNFRGNLQLETLQSIQAELGPFIVVSNHSAKRQLSFHVHKPTENVLAAFELRRQRLLFALTETLWPARLIFFVALAGALMCAHSGWLLSEHWRGHSRPWISLVHHMLVMIGIH